MSIFNKGYYQADYINGMDYFNFDECYACACDINNRNDGRIFLTFDDGTCAAYYKGTLIGFFIDVDALPLSVDEIFTFLGYGSVNT
jgi:hypothetical protein